MKAIPCAIGLLFLAFVTQALPADRRVSIPTGDSPSLGPENAPVTIIEFVDFQ